ncbi:hypothetical protein [Absidia glauca]|uniref:Uncharacterized protein n=1 Tax=Absidia glauca TaxID=4829 RepID=A0A168PAS8_ABSGL|nr:hypothetical protein [Absidia glauca]
MSFLTAKAGPSNLNNTLHHDQTLATGSQYTPAEQSTSSASFRSRDNHTASQNHDQNQFFDSFTREPSLSVRPLSSSMLPEQPRMNLPQHLQLAASSPMDGSEVLAMLDESTGVYDQEVHGDDLVAGSMSYQSYHHQSDHQHSIAEFEKQRQRQMEEWILTDDIIAYIEKQDSSYVDDVYGLPPMIANLVKEAKEELKQGDTDGQQKAVSRLQMIREHLIGRSQGNRTLAFQQGLQMKESDWAALF